MNTGKEGRFGNVVEAGEREEEVVEAEERGRGGSRGQQFQRGVNRAPLLSSLSSPSPGSY